MAANKEMPEVGNKLLEIIAAIEEAEAKKETVPYISAVNGTDCEAVREVVKLLPEIYSGFHIQGRTCP